MKEFITIQADVQVELDIKKSRFICYLKRVSTEEEARTFIQALKKEHYKANHNCSAFILGETAAIKRSSDDGEPSGTAGVPMLGVLEQHQITNTVAVVTRYFGGIKLGAGGLIRAYAASVAEAVKEIGLVTVKEQEGLQVQLSYAQYQEFATWLAKHNLLEYDTQFLENIRTTLFVDKEGKEAICQDLVDYYHGKVSIEEAGSRIVEIPHI